MLAPSFRPGFVFSTYLRGTLTSSSSPSTRFPSNLDKNTAYFFAPVQFLYNFSRPTCAIHMTTQQSGMQQTQQSQQPQSHPAHLVLPGAVPLGLMIDLVAEPGRTKSTGLDVDPVPIVFEEALETDGQIHSDPRQQVLETCTVYIGRQRDVA